MPTSFCSVTLDKIFFYNIIGNGICGADVVRPFLCMYE